MLRINIECDSASELQAIRDFLLASTPVAQSPRTVAAEAPIPTHNGITFAAKPDTAGGLQATPVELPPVPEPAKRTRRTKAELEAAAAAEVAKRAENDAATANEEAAPEEAQTAPVEQAPTAPEEAQTAPVPEPTGADSERWTREKLLKRIENLKTYVIDDNTAAKLAPFGITSIAAQPAPGAVLPTLLFSLGVKNLSELVDVHNDRCGRLIEMTDALCGA